VLCYLVGGIIAFLCSGFNYLSIVFPIYFGFLGLFPIIKCKFMDIRLNKTIACLIGLLWCIAIFYGVYFYYTMVMNGVLEGLPNWVEDYLLLFVGVVAIVFYFIYNRFVVVLRKFLNIYLFKIIK
jgi:hypothetical protein